MATPLRPMPIEIPNTLFDILDDVAADNQETRTELVRRLLMSSREVKQKIKSLGVLVEMPDRNPAAKLHAEVMKLYRQNVSQADIARRVKRSPSWILRIIKKEQRKDVNV